MRWESEDKGGKLLSLQLTPKYGLDKHFSIKLLVLVGKKGAFLSFIFWVPCTLCTRKTTLETLEML
jgi:hypothetical protein